MIDKNDLLQRCKREDPKAQRILYDLYKARLMGLSKRYSRNTDEAKDILQEAFVRIFLSVKQLESPDKLEGWMKTIVVRTAINHYHKTKSLNSLFASHSECIDVTASSEQLTDAYLVALVNALPDGCRLVFNLFAVEGYSHVEIADMLEISEGTSRSQYHHAKTLLKEKLKCFNLVEYYEKFA